MDKNKEFADSLNRHLKGAGEVLGWNCDGPFHCIIKSNKHYEDVVNRLLASAENMSQRFYSGRAEFDGRSFTFALDVK